MAKQTAGILGTVKGKVGNVVGAQWKETPYFRAYAIPANPKTELQEAHRARFALAVKFSKGLLGSVVQPFWDQFQRNQSGFNRFVQVNTKRLTSGASYDDILVAEGELESVVEISNAQYAGSQINLEWSGALKGNGLSTDYPFAVCYDTENDIFFVADGQIIGMVRGDLNIDLTVGTGRDYSKLTVFLFFYRGNAATLMVAPSVFSVVTN